MPDEPKVTVPVELKVTADTSGAKQAEKALRGVATAGTSAGTAAAGGGLTAHQQQARTQPRTAGGRFAPRIPPPGTPQGPTAANVPGQPNFGGGGHGVPQAAPPVVAPPAAAPPGGAGVGGGGGGRAAGGAGGAGGRGQQPRPQPGAAGILGQYSPRIKQNWEAIVGGVMGFVGNVAVLHSTITAFSLGMEQIARSRTRAEEDYQTRLKALDVTRRDIETDQSRRMQDFQDQRKDLEDRHQQQIARTAKLEADELESYRRKTVDFNQQREDLELHYNRTVVDLADRRQKEEASHLRAVEDFTIRRANLDRQREAQTLSFTRRQEDIQTNFERQTAEFALRRSRAEEDYQRTQSRFDEDVAAREAIRTADQEERVKRAKEAVQESGINQFLALGGLVSAAESGDPFAIIGALFRLQQTGQQAKAAKELEATGGLSKADQLRDQQEQVQIDRERADIQREITRFREDADTAERNYTADHEKAVTRLAEDQRLADAAHQAALDAIARDQTLEDERHTAALQEIDKVQAEVDADHTTALGRIAEAQKLADDDHKAALDEIRAAQTQANIEYNTALERYNRRVIQSVEDDIKRYDALKVQEDEIQRTRTRNFEDLLQQEKELKTQLEFGLGLQAIFAGQMLSSIITAIAVLRGLPGMAGAAGVAGAIGTAATGLATGAAALPAAAIGSAVLGGGLLGIGVGSILYPYFHGGKRDPITGGELEQAIRQHGFATVAAAFAEAAINDPGIVNLLPGGGIGNAIRYAIQSGTSVQRTGAAELPGQGEATAMALRYGTQASLTASQFSGELAQQFNPEVIQAICAEIVAAGLAKAFGIQITPQDVVNKVLANPGRYEFSVGTGTTASGLQKLIGDIVPGSELSKITKEEALSRLEKGEAVVINPTPRPGFGGHWLLGQGMQGGRIFVGESGKAIRGWGETVTPEQLESVGGGVNYYGVSGPGRGAQQSAISTGRVTAEQARQLGTRFWEQQAAQAAIRHGIDPRMFVEQMRAESGFDPDVIAGNRVSSAGAVGIAQIMPQYHPGADPWDPFKALDYAASHMADLTQKYGPEVALAAYNAGEGAVQRYNGIPPFSETRSYVSKITAATGAAGPIGLQQSARLLPISNQARPDDQAALLNPFEQPITRRLTQEEFNRTYGTGSFYVDAEGKYYTRPLGANPEDLSSRRYTPIPPMLAQPGREPTVTYTPGDDIHEIRGILTDVLNLLRDGKVVASINGVVFSKEGEERILQISDKWISEGRA